MAGLEAWLEHPAKSAATTVSPAKPTGATASRLTVLEHSARDVRPTV